MTEREHIEIINFAAALVAINLIADLDKSDAEKDQLILIAASYGPAINER